MEKSCVMQALEHLHGISEEELLEEWKQIESLGLPKVDADEFINDAVRHFAEDARVNKKGKTSFLKKIACL